MVNDDVFEPQVVEAISLAANADARPNITSLHLLIAVLKVLDPPTLAVLNSRGVTVDLVESRLGDIEESGPAGDFSNLVRDILLAAKSSAVQSARGKIGLQDLLAAMLRAPGSEVASFFTLASEPTLSEALEASLQAALEARKNALRTILSKGR